MTVFGRERIMFQGGTSLKYRARRLHSKWALFEVAVRHRCLRDRGRLEGPD
jgi:hypothetical protein